MAHDRERGYGRREGWRERDSSIFSDDDDRFGRGDRDDDRGFFERAGDEVRSWFGDEEAERRRERDIRRDDSRSAFGGDEDRGYENRSGGRGTGGYGFSSQSGGRSDWSRQAMEERGGWGGASFGGGGNYERSAGSLAIGGSRGRESGSGRAPWDEHYRRWRDQQIEQFDREYDDYRRERQQRFEQEFDSWRSSRLTEGGSAGGGSATGFSGDISREQGASGGSQPVAAQATDTSAPRETGGTVGAGEGASGRGRGGRSRT